MLVHYPRHNCIPSEKKENELLRPGYAPREYVCMWISLYLDSYYARNAIVCRPIVRPQSVQRLPVRVHESTYIYLHI